jgi:hypothetical protein
VISVTHFRATSGDFADRAGRALQVLAERPGYLRGTLGRSVDDESAWVLVTEWKNVGSYRRALGAYEVKLHAAPLLGEAQDVPSAFESLVETSPDGVTALHPSDREPPA